MTEYEELLWTSSMPLHAAARVGKVHLRAPGEALTLCGLVPGRPSRRFNPAPRDARCTRCAARAVANTKL